MSQRFEGRNLEDALQHASQTLGVERWQLTYHVLLEKRGFLGGIKRVVIEADVNESAAPPAAAAAAPLAPLPDVPASPAPRAPRERGPRGGGRRRERPADAAFAPMRDDRRGRGRSRGRREESDELQSGDFEKFMVDVPDQTEQSADAKRVADWIENLIDRARLDLVVRTDENETQILVKLYGRDAKRLIDRHAELLDAIQVLANKALTGRSVQKEIELDSEEYKDRRIEELRQQAMEVADRVRREGVEELLPAMTPIERRIVHLALRDDADCTTESRGEGFYKRVAIMRRPADDATES